MQRRYNTGRRSIALAGIALILTAASVPAFTHNVEPRAYAETAAKTVQIQIVGTQDTQFAPSKVRIEAGDAVRFINMDGQNGGLAHWVLSIDSASGVPNGVFGSGLMEIGDT